MMIEKAWVIGFLGCAVLAGCAGDAKAGKAEAVPTTKGEAMAMDVTFKAKDGLEMVGTLQLPEVRPAPAVLLIPGSGPTDRNGNQQALQTNLLKQIAESLASKGIASLRVDKRATPGYREHWPKDPAKISDYFSWDVHVSDLEAAYAFMASRPEVDPRRLGIVGHSEGAMYSLTLAPAMKPKAIVAIAAPGRPFLEMLTEQLRTVATKQGAPPAMVEQLLEENKKIAETLMRTGKPPATMSPGLAPLYNPSALSIMRSYFAWDGVKAVAGYDGPILIMNGDKDIQISAENDAKPLFERLRAPKDLVLIPGASHNLKPVKSDSDPGFAGPGAPEALRQLNDWLQKNLVG